MLGDLLLVPGLTWILAFANSHVDLQVSFREVPCGKPLKKKRVFIQEEEADLPSTGQIGNKVTGQNC